MVRRKADKPTLSERGARARSAREARLAQALRENLGKRKAQARARQGEAAPAARAPGTAPSRREP